MSVLIKGMEMPISCDKCIYSAWSNFYQIYVCNAVRKNEPVLFDGKQTKSTACVRSARADNCPLIPVPPHGRLIDADALRLLYDFNGYKPTGDMTEEEFDRLMCRLPVIRANIDDAPTIIESTIGQLNSDPAVNEANANTSNALNCVESEGEDD